jgi:hypothetical protein
MLAQQEKGIQNFLSPCKLNGRAFFHAECLKTGEKNKKKFKSDSNAIIFPTKLNQCSFRKLPIQTSRKSWMQHVKLNVYLLCMLCVLCETDRNSVPFKSQFKAAVVTPIQISLFLLCAGLLFLLGLGLLDCILQSRGHSIECVGRWTGLLQ